MIKVVFFDLGSTLIHNKEPWDEFFQRGDQACAKILCDAGISCDGDVFFQEYGAFLDQYYAQLRPDDPRETTAFSALKELLVAKGFPDVKDDVIRAGLDAMYAVINENWCVEEDAIPTLHQLQTSGFKLGLISNTSDDAHVQALIHKNKLHNCFEFVITSAKFGIRKPDPRIFQAALDHFRIEPGEAVMIGDTLDADILGANNIGIYSIWITRRANKPDPTINPKAVLATLEELPALLSSLNK